MLSQINYFILSVFCVLIPSLTGLKVSNQTKTSDEEYAKGFFHHGIHKFIPKDIWPIRMCQDGFPLFRHKFCDGKPDCADASDETLEQCQDKRCGERSFRCTYGGCILKELKCNGIFNCADGSDEDIAICDKDSCVVPKNTPAVSYYVLGCSGCTDGTKVKGGTALHYKCATENSPANLEIICKDGLWTPLVPICVDSSITTGASTIVTAANTTATTSIASAGSTETSATSSAARSAASPAESAASPAASAASTTTSIASTVASVASTAASAASTAASAASTAASATSTAASIASTSASAASTAASAASTAASEAPSTAP